MLPTADAVATEEPDIAANSMAARILTCASPPGRPPNRALANSISRRAIPPRFINCPASMKKGIAKSVNESSPVAIRCATVVRAGPVLMLSSMVSTVEMPMENATGTPRANRTAKETPSTKTSTHSISASPRLRRCGLPTRAARRGVSPRPQPKRTSPRVRSMAVPGRRNRGECGVRRMSGRV